MRFIELQTALGQWIGVRTAAYAQPIDSAHPFSGISRIVRESPAVLPSRARVDEIVTGDDFTSGEHAAIELSLRLPAFGARRMLPLRRGGKTVDDALAVLLRSLL